MSSSGAPSFPFSLSVAPPPMPTEEMMLAATRLIERSDDDTASVDALNRFLLSPEGQQALTNSPDESASDQARKIALKAWTLNPPERYELANKALVVDPFCSDAYLILAETTNTWRKHRRYFEQAVAASATWMHPYLTDMEKDGAPPSLYGMVKTRPWFRAQVALARILHEGGHQTQALTIYDQILKFDPEDHLGVRYELISVFHDLGDIDGLVALLERFADDSTTFLAYERLWVAVARQQKDRLERLQEAHAANPHFLEAITHSRPSSALSPYLTVGGYDEAEAYFDMAAGWWGGRPEILEWVIKHWPTPDRR